MDKQTKISKEKENEKNRIGGTGHVFWYNSF